jgi:hypothetical protein
MDVNGVLVSLKIHLINKYILQIRESYRILSSSLLKLSVYYKTQYTKYDYDIVNANEEELENSYDLLEYNSKDCYILYEVLYKFTEDLINNKWFDALNFSTASSYIKSIFYNKYYE